jgi:hypothetical protein
VQRSIATTSPRPELTGLPSTNLWGRVRLALERADAAHIGLFFVTLALGVYVFSNPARIDWYDHFVWQADAFWHGRFVIAYPVTDGPFANAYLNDVMPLPSTPGMPSYGLLPFPPLPAVLLIPFVGIFGLATDAQLFGAVLGAINVGLAWRMASKLTDRRSAAFLGTLFFAFGTVHWYAAMLSTTWFLAHVVATTFVLLGITLALDGERLEELRRSLGHRRGPSPVAVSSPNSILATIEDSSLFLAWSRRLRAQIDPIQFMAGFVFGLAALSRLTILFGAPFFVFVGSGGSYWRRALSAGLGALMPVLLLLAYNLLSTGHVFNPAYEWLYLNEYHGYMPANLQIDQSLGIEDLGHVPRNALIMLAWPPDILPHGSDCGVGLLNPSCPIAAPSAIGMSLLLTSPAYLLAVPVALAGWRRRLILGSTLAVLAIGFVILMHFGPGWVQFGFRRSNDFAPFALILVTLGIARLGKRMKLAIALVAASIIMNAWGVYWGVTLRW